MDHAGWIEGGIDRTRAARLGVGYAFGAATIVGLFLFFTGAAAGSSGGRFEEAIDVELATLPEPEPEVEPEPEPEVEPEPAPPQATPPEPVMPARAAPPAIEVPTDVPDAPAPEGDPGKLRSGDDPYQQGSGHGGSGRGPSSGSPPPPPPPPPPAPAPPPPPKGPTLITENDTPAQRISCPSPSLAPGMVKEPTVILVRIKISAAGVVERVKAMNGPAELRAIAEQTVMGCRFKPALDPEGRPKAVLTATQVPFRVTTGS